MSQTLTSHAYLNKKPLVLPGTWVVWWPLPLPVIYCLPLGESQSYKIHPSVISSPKCSMPCSCECEKGRVAFCCAWVLVCGLLIMILHQRLSVSRWPISKFRQPFSNQNRTLMPVCVCHSDVFSGHWIMAESFQILWHNWMFSTEPTSAYSLVHIKDYNSLSLTAIHKGEVKHLQKQVS